MVNPFDIIENRLINIERLLLELKHDPRTETGYTPPERRTLHSIRELAEFIECSTVTAHKFKKSGRIPCRQIGRKVMFDTVEVLKAMEHIKRQNKFQFRKNINEIILIENVEKDIEKLEPWPDISHTKKI